MIDTGRMRELLRIAERLGVARVALVGDTEQLRPVDAGQPFRLLQKAGMRTATMDEVLRQRDPALLASVMHARHGEAGEAIRGLGAERVREVEREELGAEAARCWLSLQPEDRAETAIMAPTHEIRRQTNEAVREGLAGEGVPAWAGARRRPAGQPAPHPGAGRRPEELRAGRHRGVPPRRVRLPGERRLHRDGPP